MRLASFRVTSVCLLVGVTVAGPVVWAQSSARETKSSQKGSSALDGLLKDFASYDGGIESAAAWKLREYVNARRDDAAGRAECEAGLVKFLGSGATPAAKVVAGRHLRAIAGDTAVPALQAMLGDDRLADVALYVLGPMPGAAAEQALVRSVATTKGPAQIAIVAALGERRSRAAVSAVAPLLKQPAGAVAAATALGRIGGEAAVAALVAARAGASAALTSAIATALLSCAETALAARDTVTAARLYDSLASDSSLPVPIRRAAVLGRLSAAGSASVLVEHLASSDPILHEAAIARISSVIPADGISAVSALVPKLPDSAQVQVLAVLSNYPADRVRSTVLAAARSTTPAVRLAALKALDSVGNQTDVPFLIRAAIEAKGQEQTAVRATLAALRGSGVGDAIMTSLAAPGPDDVKSELMLAAADRRLFAAKPLIVSSLTASSSTLRLSALRALRAIGTPSDTVQVLDALLAASDDRERTEAERTVVALAQKVSGADARSRFVRNRLAATKGTDARVRLIALLQMIGDGAALPVVRAALEDGDADVYDAAVRALVAWPTSAAKDDVMRLARDSRNETHRLLAIAGLVRIIGLDTHREPAAAAADLRTAAGFAWRLDEQKLILGVLGRFPCQDALDLAVGFSKESGIKAEAQAAIDRIKPRLPTSGK